MKFICRNEQEWNMAQQYLLDSGLQWGSSSKWVPWLSAINYSSHADRVTIGQERILKPKQLWYNLIDETGAVEARQFFQQLVINRFYGV